MSYRVEWAGDMLDDWQWIFCAVEYLRWLTNSHRPLPFTMIHLLLLDR